jgi:hypothetical protein
MRLTVGLLTCSTSCMTRRCCWWRGAGSSRVKGNKGARTAGVDGQTVSDIQQRRGEGSFLADLRADLKARRFAPLPVRERLIRKARQRQAADACGCWGSRPFGTAWCKPR